MMPCSRLKKIASMQLEMSQWMQGNWKKTELNCFLKKLQFFEKKIFKVTSKKYLALELFDFQDQFNIDFFVIYITQIENTGSTGKA